MTTFRLFFFVPLYFRSCIVVCLFLPLKKSSFYMCCNTYIHRSACPSKEEREKGEAVAAFLHMSVIIVSYQQNNNCVGSFLHVHTYIPQVSAEREWTTRRGRRRGWGKEEPVNIYSVLGLHPHHSPAFSSGGSYRLTLLQLQPMASIIIIITQACVDVRVYIPHHHHQDGRAGQSFSSITLELIINPFWRQKTCLEESVIHFIRLDPSQEHIACKSNYQAWAKKKKWRTRAAPPAYD